MLRYTFREPTVFQGNAQADPQRIGEALAKIAKKSGGELTPHATVDAARDRKHVLHPHFEWDDKRAAENHRLDQARAIIRSITVEDLETSEPPARAFHSITAKDGNGTSYRTLKEVLSSPDLQEILLKAAERDLAAFEARYRELVDVCALVKAARQEIVKRRNATESNAQARA